MDKILSQGISIPILFFAMWFGLSQVDWVTLFHIQEATETTEKKLGDLFWDLMKREDEEIHDRDINIPLDSILSKLCKANGIERKDIKLHVIRKDEVNAFAMPDKHLVIYTGLLQAAENEGELAGIIGHELAHIQMNHVMKKLVKEVGLSVLISITTGHGGETVKEYSRMLSSTAFDRSMEKEADIAAVDYMVKASIDPEDLANFLYKLSVEEPGIVKHLTWISTHPDSQERSEYIIEYSKDKVKDVKPILAPATWNKLKEELKELINEPSL